MNSKFLLNTTLSALIFGGVAFSAAAQDATPEAAPARKEVYIFRRPDTPTRIRPFSTTTYSSSRSNVRTVKGDILRDLGKDTVVNFEVNPTGLSYIVIEKGKKPERKAIVYTVAEQDSKLLEFNNKKYGVPLDAVYTPEGRTLVVATRDKLYLVDSRTMLPIAEFKDYPTKPGMMLVSPNGYYLVIANGEKATVYNLEERKVRATLDAGEDITDMAFSPDNSDLSLLTSDGVLSIYSTRNYELRKMVDDLGEGLAFGYNLDGKYVAVAEDPNDIVVVNLLQDSDREHFRLEEGGVSDVVMVPDASQNTLMVYTLEGALGARLLPRLKPYYNRLIEDEVNSLMDEWLKMMPGETMEQYRERVTREAQERQRSMFEFEVSTRLAGNILAGAKMALGQYDRTNQVLEVLFETMPTIYLPVPETDISAFTNGSDLSLGEVLFGVTPDDNFEIVYAEITNAINGKTYTFDNRARAQMNYMKNDDVISLEVLQQQQMAEAKLRELREQVMREAKQQNIISDHTNITVDSRLSPEYDANGEQILNYIVSFTYDVAPGFSAEEDFGPGKYHIDESGSASSMLKIVKEAFEGDLKKYVDKARKVNVRLLGTADATPIVSKIVYDGSYGDYEQEPVYVDGQLTALTLKNKELIKENPELAFVRALGVQNFLEDNVQGFKEKNKDYRYEVSVSKEKGSEFRRITAEFTFVDAF